MTTYLVRRGMQSVLILFLISIVMYFILNLNYCGPICDLWGAQYPSPAVQKAAIERGKELYGLNDPLPVRYILWLYNWKPATEVDPNYLKLQLYNYQQEYPTVTDPDRKAEVEQAMRDLPPKIADSEAKLAACGDLLNWDNVGTCLSLQRQGGILSGNWGKSWKFGEGQTVTGLIFGTQKIVRQQFGAVTTEPDSPLRGPAMNSLVLITFSILFALLLAIPIGIFSAVKQYSIGDYGFTFISFIGVGLPSFCLATLMLLLARQGWLFDLPLGGVVDDPSDVGQYGDMGVRLKHLLIPGFVLGFGLMAGFSRFIRSSMLEVLKLDYVRTAWAKGLRWRAVILKHALRNALIPLITRVALAVPLLIGGELLVTQVVDYDGMGSLMLQGALNDDWPLMMGLLIVGAVMVVVSNIIADIFYAVVDPRIRY